MKKLTVFCIDDIKAVSIFSVAEELGLEVNKHHKCLCPFHADKSPSLKFWSSGNCWKCFGCGQKGTNIDLVMKKEGLKFNEACKWIATRSGIMLRYDEDDSDTKSWSGHRNTVLPPIVNQEPTNTPIYMYTLNPNLIAQCSGTNSSFCRGITSAGILNESQLQQAANTYHLGYTKDDGVIFWQIDHQHQLRDGKVMFYQGDCHRDHNRNPSWVSYRLKKQGILTSDWQATFCLFGLHLLCNDSGQPLNQACIVAVVESEKTAIICSQLLPTLCNAPVLWMATGGFGTLNAEVLRPLVGYNVTIFPDTDPTGQTFRKWQDIVNAASKELNQTFYISNILELHATPDQKQRKIDIADFLIEKNL